MTQFSLQTNTERPPVAAIARDSWISNSKIAADQLTDRQRHEREFHREFAATHAHLVQQPVIKDVISAGPRRPWNAFWSMYDRILAADISGKSVLLPGCGFGEDAIRLSYLNAKVSAFDISPEIVEISERRARALGQDEIAFAVMPSERMEYPDNSFDLVVFVDILHHVDIPKTMSESLRVLKPCGLVIGDELYTHSVLQRIRASKITTHGLYPLMQRWIYGTDRPYITEDERKINELEFRLIQDNLTKCEADYFGIFEGRFFPNTITWVSRIDRMIARSSGRLAPLLSGRIVFRGEIRKAAA